MCIIECLAYADVKAKVSQQEEVFLLTLKAQGVKDILLTFNYLQVKVLAEGLLAVAAQAKAKKLDEYSSSLLGDIRVTLDVGATQEENNQSKGENVCRPDSLSAPTEPGHLPKAV